MWTRTVKTLLRAMHQNRTAEETLSVLCESQTLWRNQEAETSTAAVAIVQREQRESLTSARAVEIESSKEVEEIFKTETQCLQADICQKAFFCVHRQRFRPKERDIKNPI